MPKFTQKIIGEYLTYEDVLLVPGFSEVLPRDVIISSKFSKNINDFSSAKKFASTFNSNLRSMLVKSNRFAILDRKNSKGS